MSHSVDERNEHIWENRSLFLEFCLLQNLVIANTRFEQPDEHKVTYRLPGNQPTASVHEGGFEQMDYVTINTDFKSAIKTSKSMRSQCLQTDHYPVTAQIQTRFRKCKPKEHKPALRYDYKQF